MCSSPAAHGAVYPVCVRQVSCASQKCPYPRPVAALWVKQTHLVLRPQPTTCACCPADYYKVGRCPEAGADCPTGPYPEWLTYFTNWSLVLLGAAAIIALANTARHQKKERHNSKLFKQFVQPRGTSNGHTNGAAGPAAGQAAPAGPADVEAGGPGTSQHRDDTARRFDQHPLTKATEVRAGLLCRNLSEGVVCLRAVARSVSAHQQRHGLFVRPQPNRSCQRSQGAAASCRAPGVWPPSTMQLYSAAIHIPVRLLYCGSHMLFQ